MEENKSVVAVRPGLSRHADTAEFVRLLAASAGCRSSIDADGLNAFEGKAGESADAIARSSSLRTRERWLGSRTFYRAVQEDRVKIARDFATSHRCIVILKGVHTVVADHDGMVWINTR